MNRQDKLRELGLLPVWRLRQANKVAAPEPEEDSLQPQDDPCRSAFRPTCGPEGRPTLEAISLNWPELSEAVASCQSCRLHETRNRTVLGSGDPNANWLFVGEAPGAEEDKQGDPFVGQAGKLLDNMLAAIKLKRGLNVYIANTVKCRPPGNRNPEADETSACAPWLARQIELIQPKIIIALGKVAAQCLLGSEATIASLRGQVHNLNGTPLIVTYHPAYLLRSPTDKSKAWEDLCLAVRTMEKAISSNPSDSA
ncbi:MAG: uracil-DNA glycosylase [Sulfuricellaceae bacterium]|nr:uracil-DNA glycosylase [Sulfuricellaceae bacterium]